MIHEPIVEARNLSKSFRSGDSTITPVDGLELVVQPGELVALMGPSGSGKSTLLNLLGGLDRPDSGQCRVAGSELASMSNNDLATFRSRNVGFVFQTFNLIPTLTATENVELPLLLHPLSSQRRAEQANLALKVVGLSDRAHHRPGELSGGQCQRVAIARALATDAKLILADEPTGNLDEQSGERIMDVLIRLCAEHDKTIVMVTHDATKAERAGRVLRFKKGRVAPDDGAKKG